MLTTTIDIHPHIISSDLVRYPRAPLGGKPSDWSVTRPVSLPAMIAAMDGAGVQKAAIVQASTCYGHDNSYVADAVTAHPNWFTGVFSVDVLAADAPQRMRTWLDRGLTGMRLFTFGSTMSEHPRGSTIRSPIRPGPMRRSAACRSACRCRPPPFRSSC